MILSIEKRLNVLDEKLEQTFRKMSEHPEKLHYSSGKEWSPVQVLHHLYVSEFGTTNYLNKKVSTTEPVPASGLRGFIASILLKRALRNQKKKFKAPKILGDMPEKPNFDQLRKEYLDVRQEMRTVLSKFDKKMAKKAYFKHPIAGRLDIYQTLSFLEDHFQRHQEQIYQRLV